jgi:hypothetical protein
VPFRLLVKPNLIQGGRYATTYQVVGQGGNRAGGRGPVGGRDPGFRRFASPGRETRTRRDPSLSGASTVAGPGPVPHSCGRLPGKAVLPVGPDYLEAQGTGKSSKTLPGTDQRRQDDASARVAAESGKEPERWGLVSPGPPGQSRLSKIRRPAYPIQAIPAGGIGLLAGHPTSIRAGAFPGCYVCPSHEPPIAWP